MSCLLSKGGVNIDLVHSSLTQTNRQMEEGFISHSFGSASPIRFRSGNKGLIWLKIVFRKTKTTICNRIKIEDAVVNPFLGI